MASSGWQGQKDIQTSKYPHMALNLRIDGITHSGTNLRVWGAVRAVVTSGNIYYNGVYVSWPNGGYSQNMNPVSTGGYVDWSFDTTIGGISQTTTSYTFTASLSAGNVASGSASWALSFSASTSAPSTPSVSIASIAETSATFNVSLSSYGQPSGEANRYIEAAILGQNTYGGKYRYSTAKAVSSATITVSNSSGTNASNPLTIVPNTQYWYGGYASNTALANSTVTGTFVTLPASISALTATDLGHGDISIDVAHGEEGTGDTVTTEYSTDGSTWTTAATLPFTIHISQSTTVSVRRSNTSGSTAVESITIAPFVSAKLYGSVDGLAEEIETLYGSVRGVTDITTGALSGYFWGCNVNTLTEKANAELTSYFEQGYAFTYCVITRTVDRTSWTAYMQLRKDGGTGAAYSYYIASNVSFSDMSAALLDWGIATYDDPSYTHTTASLSISGTYTNMSKKVKKLYGSVEGESKLIFEDLS